MRVIAIGSGKGGVGRSTIAANLGITLAEMEKSVLIVDGSLTSPSQSLFFSLEKAPRTLNDVLEGDVPPEDAIYSGPDDIKILPAAVTISKMRNVKTSRLPDLIKSYIEGYDFVIIDTPNGLREETIASLKAGNELLIVTTPEIISVSDSMKIKAASEFLGMEPIGIVLNQVRKREYELHDDEISDIMKLPILSSVPYDEEVRRSVNEGKLLVKMNPKSPAAKEIKRLAEKLSED